MKRRILRGKKCCVLLLLPLHTTQVLALVLNIVLALLLLLLALLLLVSPDCDAHIGWQQQLAAWLLLYAGQEEA
jgi:hypothetical protein